MAGSFLARAANALKDPWSLVVAGVGAGSAWAIGLPGRRRRIGRGRDARGGRRGRWGRPRRRPAEPNPSHHRSGQGPSRRSWSARCTAIGPTSTNCSRATLAPAVAVSAVQAVEAAHNAENVANRVARAVDAVDDAVARAEGVARQMPRSGEVRASVQRMLQRRNGLLEKLTEAVDEVGEVYAKLLELSTTASLVGVDTDGTSEAAQVSDSLDAIRGVFAELEADASTARAML